MVYGFGEITEDIFSQQLNSTVEIIRRGIDRWMEFASVQTNLKNMIMQSQKTKCVTEIKFLAVKEF